MSSLSLGGLNNDSQDFMMPGGAGKSLGPPGNSNLSALFGLNNQINNNPNSNQALTYTAPKPPSKAAPKQQQATGSGPGVACAVAVTAYRYVNGQNVKQGKLGAALLKNVPEKDYKILMYVTKQQPVSTTQINPSFQFTIQTNNYASFVDDHKQTWTVLFASASQLIDFAKQVCLAKLFTSAQVSESIVIDLSPGDQPSSPVESGDSLEMKYTGWLVNSDGSLGDVFDSNHNSEKTFRFKSGRGKVIKGWDSGVLGMKKGGKRFLVIPPHLAYGSKAIGNKVPSNFTLAFEMDLLRIKQSKDNASMQSGESVESLPQAVTLSEPPPPNPAVLLPGDNPSLLSVSTDSDTVKGRSASLNEQMSNPSNDNSKNAIVSRMARMGHAMLPMAASETATHEQPQVVANDVQLQSQSPNVTQPPSRSSTPGYNQPQPGLPPQHAHVPSQANPASSHFPPQIQGYATQQTYQSSPSYSPQHLNPMQPSVHSTSFPTSAMQNFYDQPVMSSISSTGPSMYNTGAGYRPLPQYPPNQGYGSEFMPMLMSESRQQTTEVRLLQEKVDKVSNLVEEVKKITEDSHHQEKLSSSQIMDAEVIMLNVQRIMKENEQLKGVVVEKNKQIEQQNDKISDLLQQNQKYVEKSNFMLEQRNDSFKESFTLSQARSLQLEQDKVELTQRLSDATSKVSELTMEVAEQKQRETDLKQKFREHYNKEKERAEEAEEKVAELEEKFEKSVEAMKNLSSAGTDAQSQVLSLNENIRTLEEKHKEDNKNYQRSIKELSEEKESLENRLQEITAGHQDEIKQLRDNSEQASQLSKEQSEEVLTLKNQLASTEAELNASQESNEENENKIAVFQRKFTQLRTAFEEQQAKLQETETEAEESSAYKSAYERLRSQASSMKEKYEAKINELKEELEEKDHPAGEGSADIAGEVKKIMNRIFQQVRSEVDADEEYSGAHILQLLIEIIKKTTLSLLKKDESDDNNDGDDDDSDDDDSRDDGKEEDKNEDELVPENKNENLSVDEAAAIEKEAEPVREEEGIALEEHLSSDPCKGPSDQDDPSFVDQENNEEPPKKDDDDDTGMKKTVDDNSTESETKNESTALPETITSEDDNDVIQVAEVEDDDDKTKSDQNKHDDANDEFKEVKDDNANNGKETLAEVSDVKVEREDVDATETETAAVDVQADHDELPSIETPLSRSKSSSSSSLASSVDDRKPPPLFDDESDENDLDWFK